MALLNNSNVKSRMYSLLATPEVPDTKIENGIQVERENDLKLNNVDFEIDSVFGINYMLKIHFLRNSRDYNYLVSILRNKKSYGTGFIQRVDGKELNKKQLVKLVIFRKTNPDPRRNKKIGEYKVKNVLSDSNILFMDPLGLATQNDLSFLNDFIDWDYVKSQKGKN